MFSKTFNIERSHSATRHTVQFLEEFRYVGCLGTQWDVTIQPLKTRPKLYCQNKSYVTNKLVAYFSLLAKALKLSLGPNVFHMISSAQN